MSRSIERALTRCCVLVDELEIANAQFNLTAIRDRPGMLRKHVLDSLSVQPFLNGTRIADVGTGAGFPGLPLAIVESQAAVLAHRGDRQESALRRAHRRAAGASQRRGRQRARRALSAVCEPFDTIVARALSSLADFVAYAGHLCAPDGRLLAMKGKRPDEELWALPKSFRVLAVHRIKLPGLDDERHIVELSPAGPGSADEAKGEHQMKRVIAVANQKGGVGKTTTAVNLAASLTATKRRVLLIDLDPQGNATMGCGIEKNSLTRTSCDVLLGDCAAAEALVLVEYGGFQLMPGNQDLTAAEVRLLTMMAGREFKLRNALKPIRDDYDVILIDCPPSLNMLTLNALVAADSVMVPMQCEYYALEGLTALVQTIDQIRGSINPDLEIEGLLAHDVRSAQ